MVKPDIIIVGLQMIPAGYFFSRRTMPCLIHLTGGRKLAANGRNEFSLASLKAVMEVWQEGSARHEQDVMHHDLTFAR